MLKKKINDQQQHSEDCQYEDERYPTKNILLLTHCSCLSYGATVDLYKESRLMP